MTDLQLVCQLLRQVKSAKARGLDMVADARRLELHETVERTGVEPNDILWRRA